MTSAISSASSNQIEKPKQNHKLLMLHPTLQKCVATFLTIRDIQSLGLTCIGQPEKILGKGWMPNPANSIGVCLLAQIIRSRFSLEKPMSGNDFLAYKKLYETRPLPEINSLNLLEYPYLTSKLPMILPQMPGLKNLTFESCGKEQYEWILAIEDFHPFQISILKPEFSILTYDNAVSIVSIKDSTLALLSNHDLEALEFKHSLFLTGEGLNFLKKASLHSLKIECCKNFSDDAMKILPAFPLRTLKLAHCTTITSEGWKNLANLQHLENLDLTGCDQLTDQDLMHLRALPLKTLNLTGCSNITEEGLDCLKSLNLESLNVEDCLGISSEALIRYKDHQSQEIIVRPTKRQKSFLK